MTSMSPINTAAAMSGDSSHGGSVSPRPAAPPKNVAFELLFLDSPQYRARLPMRVQIYPHDTTDSIVTTVKNFYGLYSGPTGSKGVSFEDQNGTTLIARYENFRNNMVVYVRVIEEPPVASTGLAQQSFHPSPPTGFDGYYPSQAPYQDQHHQQQHYAQNIGRPSSRASQRRSPSPNGGRGRRSDSVSTTDKQGRSRSTKSRRSMGQAHADGYESANGYSSGDGAPSTASARAKELLGTTDISVENIVEGGRRKRAKFESSELPLFAPPQMPAATSNPSVSPARRIEHQRPSLPFVHPGQHPFTNPRPMQSPQSYNGGSGQPNMYATPAHGHRSRDSIGYASNGSGVGNGMGILPTPDPTVGSCMSEEDKDVAIQLMRLGEMSNISHGRTSASTLDDTFSGRADAASSTGATSDGDSDSEEEYPAARRQKLDASGAARLVYQTTEAPFTSQGDSADASADDADYEENRRSNFQASTITQVDNKPPSVKHKSTPSLSKPAMPKAPKAPRPANGSKAKKASAAPAGPMSPSSATHSRKPSVASVGQTGQSGEDDTPDLSSKPRCQRCRKSKKGCDRQRPCGRCRDAGLSADQCISEDEGNGRKGRYGRHMGVPIKKEEVTAPLQPSILPPPPVALATAASIDKSKKRKR